LIGSAISKKKHSSLTARSQDGFCMYLIIKPRSVSDQTFAVSGDVDTGHHGTDAQHVAVLQVSQLPQQQPAIVIIHRHQLLQTADVALNTYQQHHCQQQPAN